MGIIKKQVHLPWTTAGTIMHEAYHMSVKSPIVTFPLHLSAGVAIEIYTFNLIQGVPEKLGTDIMCSYSM